MRHKATKRTEEPFTPKTEIVLSQTSDIRITFEDTTNIIVCKWARTQTFDSIKASGEIILNELIQRKATKVLNDNSDVESHWEYAVDWTIGYWFPAMSDAGLQYFGWVLSKDIFARVSARRAGQPFHAVRFFRSYHYAYDWLKNLPEQRMTGYELPNEAPNGSV